MSLFPSSASTGQVFTTSASVNYRYNGEAWIFVPSSRGIFTVTSTTRPVNPDEGLIIYETDTDQVLVWNGTEWTEIRGGGGTLLFQDTQPDVNELDPGALWVDSNENVGTGLDIQTFLRWNKVLSASATTISGYDSNNLNLLYTPGFEQVYINGTLINRGLDYTATTGNTVVLSEAAFAGDLIEIHAFESFGIADVYTKTESDNRYFLNAASANFEPNIAYVSASPSSPSAGTLWIDSTNSNAPALKVYNGSTWIAVSGASEAGLHPFFQAGI